MKRTLLLALITLALPTLAHAQRLNLDFGALSSKAVESVDVTLDGDLLRMASHFLSDDDADERAVRDIVNRLEGIYVRSYTFDKANAYDPAVLDTVRRQLGPTWKRMVNVKSRGGENVEIYADTRGSAIAGLLIVSAEPRELTVVNIVGPIDLDKLAKLEGQFGIPKHRYTDDATKGARP